MYDEDEYEDQEVPEQKVKSFAEAVKHHVCAQVDAQADRFITEFRNEQEAVKELASIVGMLNYSGNSTASRGHLPLTDRVAALITEARELRQQLKDRTSC